MEDLLQADNNACYRERHALYIILHDPIRPTVCLGTHSHRSTSAYLQIIARNNVNSLLALNLEVKNNRLRIDGLRIVLLELSIKMTKMVSQWRDDGKMAR